MKNYIINKEYFSRIIYTSLCSSFGLVIPLVLWNRTSKLLEMPKLLLIGALITALLVAIVSIPKIQVIVKRSSLALTTSRGMKVIMAIVVFLLAITLMCTAQTTAKDHYLVVNSLKGDLGIVSPMDTPIQVYRKHLQIYTHFNEYQPYNVKITGRYEGRALLHIFKMLKRVEPTVEVMATKGTLHFFDKEGYYKGLKAICNEYGVP